MSLKSCKVGAIIVTGLFSAGMASGETHQKYGKFEKPVVHQQKPIVRQKPIVDQHDQAPVVHEQAPVVHEQAPVVHEQAPVVHEQAPVVHEQDHDQHQQQDHDQHQQQDHDQHQQQDREQQQQNDDSNSSLESAASSALSDEESRLSSARSDAESEASSIESARRSREESKLSRLESEQSSAESDASSDASNEDSRVSNVMSAQEELDAAHMAVMHKKVKRAQAKIDLPRIKKLLDCATHLVEEQFLGRQSAEKGMNFLAELQKRLSSQRYDYNDLYRACKELKSSYKKAERKGQLQSLNMIGKEKNGYMSWVKSRYGKSNPGLVAIAEKAMNPSMTCKKTTGFNLTGGLGFALSFGGDHYLCRTPLGRKYHIAGPSFGLGYGIGATADVGVADPNRFTIPMHRRGMIFTSDNASSGAAVFGMGETETNDMQLKSNDLTVGAGVHKTKRGHALIKIGGKSNYVKSGLYRMLGLPLAQHY